MDMKDFERRLEEAKGASASQLMMRVARLLNDRAIARLREETGLEELRASHTALFPHIDMEGTRLTTLAERLGVSKQAAGQLVDDLERMGVVERVRDPSDGRAKLITFVFDGEHSLLEGMQALQQLDAEIESIVGRMRAELMRESLAMVLAWLEDDEEAPEAT